MNRRKRGTPAPKVHFEHIETGWVETCDEGSPAADRLGKEDEWRQVDVIDSEEEIHASAAARKLAEELGVDLTEVEGTGSGGSITKGDVKDAADGEEPGED